MSFVSTKVFFSTKKYQDCVDLTYLLTYLEVIVST